MAKQYIENADEVSSRHKQALLHLKPSQGVLCVLDVIVDYLDFEDLERIALVSHLFWFVATQDRLLTKFESQDDLMSSGEFSKSKNNVQHLINGVFYNNEMGTHFNSGSTKIRTDSTTSK